MEIYKDVPEKFHNQFMETITMLEQKKGSRKIRTKGMLPLVAVLILAISTLTVSAACVFVWHQAAKEKLGVTDELAESMLEEGIAKQESAFVSEGDVSINMLQSVMTDKYCYMLLSVDVPEEIVVDADTLFREMYVESDVKFDGCTINQVSGSVNGMNSLWEIQLLTMETENYGGAEVEIVLNDLIQTRKTEITEILVEGEWRLPVTLPLEPEILVSRERKVLQIGTHEVRINRMEIRPFEVRIYGEKEELQHAIHYQRQKVSGIEYRDGTFVEEDVYIDVTKGRTDERTGEYYIGVDLTAAIDIQKYYGLVLEEIAGNDKSSEGTLGETTNVEKNSEIAFEDRAGKGDVLYLLSDEIADMTVLYERCGHKLLYNEDSIFLWDEICQTGKEIVNLEELGYDKDDGKVVLVSEAGNNESEGDRIEVGPGGKIIKIWADTENYFYEVLY